MEKKERTTSRKIRLKIDKRILKIYNVYFFEGQKVFLKTRDYDYFFLKY